MRYLLILLIASCASVPKPKSESDITWVQGLQASKQETNTWCAAAASQMLMSKWGVFPPQCEIIGKTIDEDCCKTKSVKCERSYTNVEGTAQRYGFKTRLLPVTFQTVIEKVKSGSAVSIYHLQGAANNGHAVVAYGTYKIDGKDYLIVYDPIGGVKRFWDERWVIGNLAWYRVVEVIK